MMIAGQWWLTNDEKYNHVYNISFGNSTAFLEIKVWVSAKYHITG